jgi:hypothetical protein
MIRLPFIRATRQLTQLLPVLTLSIGLTSMVTPAQAALGAPRIGISDAPTVSDSNGNTTALFQVDAIYDPVLVTCSINNPDCNRKLLSLCVGFHTEPLTATANEDFVPTSGQLSTTVVVDGPDLIHIGSVPVTIFGDALVEGTESFRVELSNGIGCANDGSLDNVVAEGTIVDTNFEKSDLLVSDIALLDGCQIQLTLTNAGAGPVPDTAYHPTSGAVLQMRTDGQPWGGLRLSGADPSRLLQTPGASMRMLWFPNTPNLVPSEGLHRMEATIDQNNVVPESIETNNTRRERAVCF